VKGNTPINPKKHPSFAPTRIWEVDTLRGFAIVEMVFYHFTWDLSFFGLLGFNPMQGPWQWFARSIATLFILTMGISMTLSFNRERQKLGHDRLFGKYLKRGATIFGFGLLITIATYFFIGKGFVIFGILHLLGFSVVAAYPFLKQNRWVSLGAGILVILAGIRVDGVAVDWPWLIWLGVKQYGVFMVDYYPVLPWFGLSLLGIFVGQALYPHGRRNFSIPPGQNLAPVRGLQYLGRHSLLIYLIHQPILIGLLYAAQFAGLI
jgi:uncharacterized membrane protein